MCLFWLRSAASLVTSGRGHGEGCGLCGEAFEHEPAELGAYLGAFPTGLEREALEFRRGIRGADGCRRLVVLAELQMFAEGLAHLERRPEPGVNVAPRVEDDDPARGLHDALQLLQDGYRVLPVMEGEGAHDAVERAVGERQDLAARLGEDHALCSAGGLGVGGRLHRHGIGEVRADDYGVGEKFGNLQRKPARPAPDVENAPVGRSGDIAGQGRPREPHGERAHEAAVAFHQFRRLDCLLMRGAPYRRVAGPLP